MTNYDDGEPPNMDDYFESDPVEWVHSRIADDALRAAWRDQRPPGDAVPTKPVPTDWASLTRAAREGGLFFSYIEVSEDGVTTVTEPIALVVPWGDDPQ